MYINFGAFHIMKSDDDKKNEQSNSDMHTKQTTDTVLF